MGGVYSFYVKFPHVLLMGFLLNKFSEVKFIVNGEYFKVSA